MSNLVESQGATTTLPPAIMREFLYADLDRARSLMSQRLGGVPEEDSVSEAVNKRFAIGVRNYLGFSRDGKAEDSVQRSLLDALLPELEGLLEAEGWLTNITEELADSSTTQERLELEYPPGCLVKIEAIGQLFDTKYLAETFGGFSVAAGALFDITRVQSDTSIRKGKGPRQETKQRVPAAVQELEDLVQDFNEERLGISPDSMRNIVRVARGIFSSGLHLLLSPHSEKQWSVTVRLQEGKRYLDAERDILFSRYGLSSQRWTVLGTVGHYAPQPQPPAAGAANLMSDQGTIDRNKFIAEINKLLSFLATQGISDAPARPGFSVIPIAVYRPIPQPNLQPE